MDMGIAGRWAIVCASSKGLGRGCAAALAAEGVNIVVNGRTAETVAATAAEIRRASGVQVLEVAADVATEAGRAALLAACPNPDILVNNAGGPPPGDFRDWERDDWIKALDANMLSPIALIKATVDGMMERGFGRIVNITSAAVKAPIPILGLSNGARSGLTGFVAGLSRETVARNVTINGLLPGPFNTDRLKQTMNKRGQTGEDFEATMKREAQGNPARRFGEPDEFGAACAFLCSVHAGYITGQNLLMDGGSYKGTF
ncbi:MAG: SDR family oxidoreductase [Proteobacteria bacterium]|nr:SDR family oxidoreductase [Pseudomonadota bacterium]